jgi:ketosteroid isomerase-like protein
MSSENVEVVRQPVAVRAESRRRLTERLAMRFPRITAFLARRGRRLSPHSRLRQAVLRQVFRQGIESLNRGDFEAVFSFWDRECEFLPVGGAPLGLEGTRGPDERIRFQQRWIDEWGEFRFEPEEIIDFGDDRLMWVGRTTGSGLSSGAAVESQCAVLLTLSAGRVIREEVYFDRAQALEAAGLAE